MKYREEKIINSILIYLYTLSLLNKGLISIPTTNRNNKQIHSFL